MLRLIMIICCCLLQQQIISQTFNVADNYNTNGIIYESVAMSKSAIYTNGYGSEISSPLSPKLYISKFSPKGDFIYNKGYSEPGLALFSSPQGLIIRNDSLFNFGQVQGNGYYNRITCLVTDTNGNKLVFNEYNDTLSRNEVMFQAQLMQNKNGFLLVGFVQKSSTLDVNAGVFFLNNKFELIKKYQYGSTDKNEIAYSAAQLHNGNIVIGAHRTDAQRVNGTRYQEQTWIFEIDTNGNMVRQFIDPDTRTGPAKGITQSADGGFVYCGKYQVGWDTSTFYRYNNSIAKISSDLSLKEWENIIEGVPTNLIGLNDLNQDGKGNIVTVGKHPVELESTTTGFDITGIIGKFDKNGNQIWLRNYRRGDSLTTNTENDIYDLELLQNGELLMVGKSEFRLGSPKYGWILKLDSNGCYDNGFCGYPVVSVKEQANFENKDFVIYPNPVKETLFFNTQESIEYLKIYNSLGQLVVEKKYPPNQVNLSALKGGLYFMKVKTAKGVITKKIVKE